MVTGAGVSANDKFILKPVGPLNEIVQVEVSIFVDFFTAMLCPNETHLCYQDLCPKKRLASVQSGRAGVPGVSNKRSANFPCYFNSRKAQIANLVTLKTKKFFLELMSSVPNEGMVWVVGMVVTTISFDMENSIPGSTPTSS